MNNFNHAGKILEYPIPSDELIKENLKQIFISVIKDFRPKFIIPFASFHYYRAPESVNQNQSLLTVEEISKLQSNILNTR